MKQRQRRGTLREMISNFNAPPPLPKKLAVILRNYWRRIVLRQACCGHDGEPGC